MNTNRTKKTTLQNDQEALQATAETQQQTKQALARMQASLVDTQNVGATTLEELQNQRSQAGRIDKEGDRLHSNLDETEYLTGKLGSWFGGKKKKKYQKQAVAAPAEKENSQPKKSSKLKWSLRKSSKTKKEPPTLSFEPNYLEKEATLYQGEHKAEMQQIAQEDKEIDAGLDMLSNQLATLFDTAQVIGDETKQQGQNLEGINRSMEDAQERQKKVNKKVRKHL